MRVEGLDLQVPVVLVAVGFQEFETGGEGLRLGCELLLGHVLSVDPVLARDAAEVLGSLRVRHLALPGVALLTAHVHPTRIAVVVGGAAILPVVIVVGDQCRVDAVFLQNREGGVVEGFERPPGPMQEIVPSRMQFAPGRHAGHGADVVVVEGDRAFAQAHEVRRQGPVAAVVRQHVPVQGIVHDHDGFHGGLPFAAAGVDARVVRSTPCPHVGHSRPAYASASLSDSAAASSFATRATSSSASFAAMSWAEVAGLMVRSMARMVPSAPM